MVVGVRCRINTVGIELLRGTINQDSALTLWPLIIRETYGIEDCDLYGVALNGNYRMFVKLLSSQVYEDLLAHYQDVAIEVNEDILVKMVDVSSQFTYVKLRNVPFEANEADLRSVFGKFGTVHVAQQGKWTAGAYVGYPEGSFSLKMTLRQPIPSYVFLEEFKTQILVTYAGQRRTCRLCDGYDHIAAECVRRRTGQGIPRSDISRRGPTVTDQNRQDGRRRDRLWSEEVEEMQHEVEHEGAVQQLSDARSGQGRTE
nr:uncharacterized protein LOC128699066 [Cherax quadricarinatus]